MRPISRNDYGKLKRKLASFVCVHNPSRVRPAPAFEPKKKRVRNTLVGATNPQIGKEGNTLKQLHDYKLTTTDQAQLQIL